METRNKNPYDEFVKQCQAEVDKVLIPELKKCKPLIKTYFADRPRSEKFDVFVITQACEVMLGHNLPKDDRWFLKGNDGMFNLYCMLWGDDTITIRATYDRNIDYTPGQK